MFLEYGLQMPHTGGRRHDRNKEEGIPQALIKMGYWTPLSINRMALTALGYHSEGTIKPHFQRSLVRP
jgi:hypothetical protein